MIDFAAERDKALAGRKLWLDLKETYGINDLWCLLVLPEEDPALNDCAYHNVYPWMKQRCLSGVCVVKLEDCRVASTSEAGDLTVRYADLKPDEMECLLSYYKLCSFFENTVVVSVHEPIGNLNFLGKHGLTLDDFIRETFFYGGKLWSGQKK